MSPTTGVTGSRETLRLPLQEGDAGRREVEAGHPVAALGRGEGCGARCRRRRRGRGGRAAARTAGSRPRGSRSRSSGSARRRRDSRAGRRRAGVRRERARPRGGADRRRHRPRPHQVRMASRTMQAAVMAVRPDGSQRGDTSTRSKPTTRAGARCWSAARRSGTETPPGSGAPVPGRDRRVEDVDVDGHVEGLVGQLLRDGRGRLAGRAPPRPGRRASRAAAPTPRGPPCGSRSGRAGPAPGGRARGSWPRRSSSARPGIPGAGRGGRRTGRRGAPGGAPGPRRPPARSGCGRHRGRPSAGGAGAPPAGLAPTARSWPSGSPSGTRTSPASARARSVRSRSSPGRVGLDEVGRLTDLSRDRATRPSAG